MRWLHCHSFLIYRRFNSFASIIADNGERMTVSDIKGNLLVGEKWIFIVRADPGPSPIFPNYRDPPFLCLARVRHVEFHFDRGTVLVTKLNATESSYRTRDIGMGHVHVTGIHNVLSAPEIRLTAPWRRVMPTLTHMRVHSGRSTEDGRRWKRETGFDAVQSLREHRIIGFRCVRFKYCTGCGGSLMRMRFSPFLISTLIWLYDIKFTCAIFRERAPKWRTRVVFLVRRLSPQNLFTFPSMFSKIFSKQQYLLENTQQLRKF